MIRFVLVLLTTIAALTVVNISMVKFFSDSSYIYFVIFLLNILTLFILTQFYQSKNEKVQNKENDTEISEKSIAIFIRLFIYIFPIIALFGLYLVSILDDKNTLGIEDANSWVGFILGIASFVMSLITLWQGEGTYNKIFDALDEVRRNTDAIKRNTDIIDYTKVGSVGDLGLKRDLLISNDKSSPVEYMNDSIQPGENGNENSNSGMINSSSGKAQDEKQSADEQALKETMNKSPFEK
jgi:hypothetical protein